MPDLNWDRFVELPGAAERNFESLCRAIVRRHYARYGRFSALASQPGVEFHLLLHDACSLGDPGRWYGWQCRWYALPSGRALGTTRRHKIKEAIETTARHLPGVTDWVLWTRYPLTSGDQSWYYGLASSTVRLHLWTAAQVEEHLSGEADIFRGTYFGELVLTPESLNTLHAESVAAIRGRWQPNVHQSVKAERTLRQMLIEPSTWDQILNHVTELIDVADLVGADLQDLEPQLAEPAGHVETLTRQVADAARKIHLSLTAGNLDSAVEEAWALRTLMQSSRTDLPRRLRANRHRSAISTANAFAIVRSTLRTIARISNTLATSVIAVIADAGCGKTQLAAQLTAAIASRPAGLLLYGRDLHAGQNLDDLARKVVIQGVPVASMMALIAAVDAAGQRANTRLPIVIDGLNEAEDPRDWLAALARLTEMLRPFSHVLFVCTLRGAFQDEALPTDTARIEIPDFEDDAISAIRGYFEFYRIDAIDASLPFELLKHPLTLRLFCEVTNPRRLNTVGIDAMPGSLTALFDRYLQQAANRVAEVSPRTYRHFAPEVIEALSLLGEMLWDNRARSVDLAIFRERLRDTPRPWNESLVRALEHDGVLLRFPGERPHSAQLVPLYDALAGHLIADSLLARMGRVGINEWVGRSETQEALSGDPARRHPYADDVIKSLAALVPRRFHGMQLWPHLNEPLRTDALRQAAELESTYLDRQTVDALVPLVAERPFGSRDIFDRLWNTRGSASHALNAEFLDAALRPLEPARRDARWSEWLRRHHEHVIADLEQIEERLKITTDVVFGDHLRARWVMWALTSTVRSLRDQATRTLYWFGRRDAGALFDLTIDALGINDPYVPERMLAASYGIALANQRPSNEFIDVLRSFLEKLAVALTGSDATHPTNHWLIRLYVEGIVAFAKTFCLDAVPEVFRTDGQVRFAKAPSVDPILDGDGRSGEFNRAIHMDFENYTLGRLFDDRRNYDINHAGHKAAVAHVRGTLSAMGWRSAVIGSVDDSLYSYTSRMRIPPTERYGKKYSWIGFHTYAGMLAGDGQLRERLSDLHIDPSFPIAAPRLPFDLPSWARDTPRDNRRWIREGTVAVPDELLYCARIGEWDGPWIAVDGFLDTERESPGRNVFGMLTAMLVSPTESDRIVRLLRMKPHPGRWWVPERPDDYYTFAGEIPWHPHFATDDEEVFDALYHGSVDADAQPSIEAEILGHSYSWESYHSDLNNAAIALVPSKSFSKHFDLRGVPQSFDQVLPSGERATLSFVAPMGYEGYILYLREDLLHRYANGRSLIWFFWGERRIYPYQDPVPKWLDNAARASADVWRVVKRGEELAPRFAARRSSAVRRRSGGRNKSS